MSHFSIRYSRNVLCVEIPFKVFNQFKILFFNTSYLVAPFSFKICFKILLLFPMFSLINGHRARSRGEWLFEKVSRQRPNHLHVHGQPAILF